VLSSVLRSARRAAGGAVQRARATAATPQAIARRRAAPPLSGAVASPFSPAAPKQPPPQVRQRPVQAVWPQPVREPRPAQRGTPLLVALQGGNPLLGAFIVSEALAPPVALRDKPPGTR
jgi:hypothetical protein